MDEAFFREWDTRQPGAGRSLDRARALRDRAGLGAYTPSTLVVVGSKGKGTAAVYASAYLAAAGRRVVTVTSPSLRSSTERIRVGGQAVDEQTLSALGRRLAAAVEPPGPGEGYLSPSGMFLLAGLRHAHDLAADHVVLEAGRGGASDEVSLVAPDVVAVTPIFDEHVNELGGSVAAVVADKCGVVRDSTRAVVVGPQEPGTRRLIEDAVGLPVTDVADGLVPDDLLPPGLGAANARLGCTAAARLLETRPDPAALAEVLRTVTLPGRLSVHPVPGTSTRVLLDAAVNRTGIAAALDHARTRLGGIDHVLLSLPDDKDLPGAAAELAGLPVTFVTVPAGHLRYTRSLPAGWQQAATGDVDRAVVAGLGHRVVAVGTVSFVGYLLALLDIDASTAFRAPGHH